MKSIDWGGQSAQDPQFLDRVRQWIEQDGEIYVMYWFARAGGAKAHFLFKTYGQFLAELSSPLYAGMQFSIDVYRHPQFPVRGWANREFIDYALSEIPEGNEWLLVGFEDEFGMGRSIGGSGDDNHKALAEVLRKYIGKYVIISPDIHWPVAPHDYPGEWISAEVN